jgi:alpha-L-fucosidase
VEACREFGLRIGFYYSLMDWHHPDGARCYKDAKARRRFLDFTQGCVRELMSNYGKIDILWYDVSWPLESPDRWESAKMNALVRKLQPDIIINNRSQLPEDFGTPEEHISAAEAGRAWEACMTFNGSWGWRPTPPEDWHSARKVVQMLQQVTAGGGNLLLNVGPMPDGSVPPEATERLTKVGKWLSKYGEVIYGKADHVEGLESWSGCGTWSRKGKTHYFWVVNWPGERLAIGGLKTKVKSVALLPEGKRLRFEQEPGRLIVKGLPKRCPDRLCQIGMLKVEFAGKPRQHLGAGVVEIK